MGTTYDYPLTERDQVDGSLHLVPVDLARALLKGRVVRRERGLELRRVEREERRRGKRLHPRLGVLAPAPVLLAGGGLKPREAVEPERLGEAHDGRARGVGPPGELLGGVEGGFVEMVDDVAGDVLLRAREVVEALADLARERGDLGGDGARHAPRIRPRVASSFPPGKRA